MYLHQELHVCKCMSLCVCNVYVHIQVCTYVYIVGNYVYFLGM